jgi:hypothetical protein
MFRHVKRLSYKRGGDFLRAGQSGLDFVAAQS